MIITLLFKNFISLQNIHLYNMLYVMAEYTYINMNINVKYKNVLKQCGIVQGAYKLSEYVFCKTIFSQILNRNA
jgi:hypothetical protein